jgi:hypothetical protein
MRKLDLTGQRFGHLTVIRLARMRNHRCVWLCQCDCGKKKEILGASLRYGSAKSCACRQLENAHRLTTTHGHTRNRKQSLSYRSYFAAKTRCTNPKQPHWHLYGGRGIKFRFKSFEQFYKEMGDRPKGKSLDRINNEGHYEPGNVRWATPREQWLNSRTAKRIANATSR